MSLFDIFPKKQAETPASIVTVDDSAGLPVAKMKVKLEPVQDLHGYSNPWPGGGGKNKFGVADVADLPNGTSRKLSISDGLMTVTATAGVSSTVVIGQSVLANVISNATLPAGTYYFKIFDFSSTVTGATVDRIKLRIETNGTNTDYARNTAFTLSADSTIVGFYVDTALQWNSGNTLTFRVAIASTDVDAWTPYSNICPISGRMELNVYDDPKYGGMIVWNQIFRAGANGSSNGLTFSHDNAWATQTITGTSTATVYKHLDMENTIVDHVYFVDKGTDNTNMQIYNDNAGVNTTTSSQHGLGKATASKKFYLWFRNGSTFNLTIKPMIYDLTVMFGSAKADEIYAMEQAEAGSGVAYFKTLFAKEYYPYNAGVTTNVSAVDGTTYWKETVDWSTQAGTVYGGTLDVVTGVLTVGWAIETFNGTENGWSWYGSYNQASIALSNTAKYNASSVSYVSNVFTAVSNQSRPQNIGNFASLISSGAGAAFSAPGCDTLNKFKAFAGSTNIQFAYELATPLTYQLTPQELVLIKNAINNVWTNAGYILEFEYYAEADYGPISGAFIDGQSLQDAGWFLKWRKLSASKPKVDYTSIYGKDGSIDQTEVLGDVFYEDRDVNLDMVYNGANWSEAYSDLLNAVHGQSCMVQFTDDPYWYWSARLVATEFSHKEHSLAMNGVAFPYKLSILEKSYQATVSGATEETATELDLEGSRMKVSPKVVVTGSITLKWGTNTKTLSAGTYYVRGLKVGLDGVTIKVWGTGTVTITYREGSL